MAKNWALVIGINQYNPTHFAPLRYARHDAELMRDFFEQEAQFNQVCFFSETAPDLVLPNGVSIPTYPSFGNLRSFLRDRFETPFLSTGDNCWFFFAGHGMQYADRDYLIPIDANPRDRDALAIPVSFVRERLSRCGADNVILILDACRNEGGRSAPGVGDEFQQGIITISSCSPTQTSWEIDDLQQGVFTYALLEALRLPGERSCATVERLNNYLRHRVPALCQHYGKVLQTPRISADPSEKHHFILLPQHAWDTDITMLKNDVYRLAFSNKLDLAEQLCIRAIVASMGRDLDLLDLLTEIRQRKQVIHPSPIPQPSAELEAMGGRLIASPSPQPIPIPPPSEADDLSSDRLEANYYAKLRDLLKAGKWKEADQETNDRMCEVMDRQQEGWLRVGDIEKFPCQDLKNIDRLWVRYSQGKYGFSVQKKIWQECHSPTDYSNDWVNFGDQVGWCVNGNWISYSRVKFGNFAPEGHLPRGRGAGTTGLAFWVSSLSQRLVSCSTE